MSGARAPRQRLGAGDLRRHVSHRLRARAYTDGLLLATAFPERSRDPAAGRAVAQRETRHAARRVSGCPRERGLRYSSNSRASWESKLIATGSAISSPAVTTMPSLARHSISRSQAR